MWKTKRTVYATALAAAMGMMGHVACEPTDGPSSQSNNVTSEEDVCRVPRILFVVDASASMLETISEDPAMGAEAGKSKWEALAGAVESLTEAHSGTAMFGLMTFPGASGGCSAGDVLLDPTANNEAAINQRIAELPIANDAATPAGQTLMKAAQNEQLLDPSYDNYVVFISDGWQYCNVASDAGAPTCAAPADCEAMGIENCGGCNSCQVNDTDASCQGQNADGCFCVRNWPVLGVQALKDAGVNTYVVGFGDNVDALTLNQAAHVGGDPLPDCDPNSTDPSCYLKAGSPDELTAALDKIMLRLTRQPCEGDCGIAGKKTCTLAGWSECQAPTEARCASDCGTEGIQQCIEGQLSKCSATCDEPAGRGGSDAGGAGGSGGEGGQTTTGSGGSTPGTGGSAAGTGGSASGSGGADGGAGGASTGSGIGGWPDDEDPWEPPEDYGDDWYDDDGGELPTGVPESDAGDPEAEGGCAYAPQPRDTDDSLAILALGVAAALTRRRRR